MPTILAIGPNHWAKGETEDEATANLRRHGARLSDGYAIITFPDSVEFEGVDEFGRYHYRSKDGVTPPPAPEKRLVPGTSMR